ncbi:hypothetical protein HYV57_00620 [Candidatus Peregrinibacteria bacterium]|nr:hypothetical protein [Candidatus Peregrinibacteria bacterium]
MNSKTSKKHDFGNEKIRTKTLNDYDAIMATIAYFDIFDFPLKENELKKYLYRGNSTNFCFKNLIKIAGDEKIKKTGIGKTSAETQQFFVKNSPGIIDKSIKFCDEYIVLNNRESIVQLRKEREKRARKLWKKTRRYAYYMQCLPFIQMVAVCNNLSYDNPSEKSDIDLFVICKKNRLYLGRTFLTFWLHVFGARRHHSKISGRFCLSFFISEDHLNLENIMLKNHDIYLAYWLKTLKPLFGKKTYIQLMKKNEHWHKKYFSEQSFHFDRLIPHGAFLKIVQTCQEWILNITIAPLLEKWLKHWQQNRALKKARNLNQTFPNVIITDTMLKFHDKDTRKKIQKLWIQRWKKPL